MSRGFFTLISSHVPELWGGECLVSGLGSYKIRASSHLNRVVSTDCKLSCLGASRIMTEFGEFSILIVV